MQVHGVRVPTSVNDPGFPCYGEMLMRDMWEILICFLALKVQGVSPIRAPSSLNCLGPWFVASDHVATTWCVLRHWLRRHPRVSNCRIRRAGMLMMRAALLACLVPVTKYLRTCEPPNTVRLCQREAKAESTTEETRSAAGIGSHRGWEHQRWMGTGRYLNVFR